MEPDNSHSSIRRWRFVEEYREPCKNLKIDTDYIKHLCSAAPTKNNWKPLMPGKYKNKNKDNPK